MPQLYNMDWDKPRPLVPRRLRFEIEERMGGDGAVVTPLNPASVIAALEKMRGQDVDSVAICLLHSYVNPAHERAVMELVRRHAPHLSISASHQVMPEIREYERTSTTVVNAFVKPVVDQLSRRRWKRASRHRHPRPADGDAVLRRHRQGRHRARQFPAYCVESGPAAGAIGAAALGEMLGEANIIAFDMGGTTAKACLIEGGEPRLTDEMEVGAGHQCRPAIAGRRRLSGAFAHHRPGRDRRRRRQPGLDRPGRRAARRAAKARAPRPGPACYGLGGTRPTVTDANVVLGFLNPVASAGRRHADRHRCRPKARSIEHVAGTAGLGLARSGLGHPCGGRCRHDPRHPGGVQRDRPRAGRFRHGGIRRQWRGAWRHAWRPMPAFPTSSFRRPPACSARWACCSRASSTGWWRCVGSDVDKIDCAALNARRQKLYRQDGRS